MIYYDLDFTQEADIFANQLKYTKALTSYEIFNANIEAGNDKQLMIRDLVHSFGLRISKAKETGAICAISTLENIFDKYGFHVLHRTLTLCFAAWEGDAGSFAGNILMGIAKLIVAYGENLKDDVFKEKLGAVSIREVLRSAKERNNGSMGYAEAMLAIYNRRMKPGLPWNKLFSANSKYKRVDDDTLSFEQMSVPEESEEDGSAISDGSDDEDTFTDPDEEY